MFSILDSNLLDVGSIRNIAKSVSTTFQLISQQLGQLGIDTFSTNIMLKDFDTTSGRPTWESIFYYSPLRDTIQSNAYDYSSIVPIVKYSDIREDSQVIYEDDDTIEIEYGSFFTQRCRDVEEVKRIRDEAWKGSYVETGRKITLIINEDGSKVQLRVFKNPSTGDENVFLTINDDGTINDSPGIATTIGKILPLKWTVDKKTGIAICNDPLFFAENSVGEFKDTEVAKFLESPEFAQELGVAPLKKKRDLNNSPFGKKERLNLEETIKRVLIGEKRIPYLVGHPGIGKTQIAKSVNKNCISFNISTFTPDAFTGKTSIVPGDKTIIHQGNTTIEHSEAGRTATAEPEWHTKLIALSNECRARNERCVLLLDEFDKLTPNMQVFINGIVDTPRTIAGWELPDNVDLILAGNTEEYSDAAFKITGEVASRVSTIPVTPDSIDWLRWASKHDIDPIVKAYLHNFPNKIIEDVKDKNGEYDPSKSLTPRSWDQKISEELKAARSIGAYPLLEPYMDEKCLREFEEFMNMYIELGVEEILKGNFPDDFIFKAHDKVQIIINCLIATATTEEELVNSLTFIRSNGLNEYQALFEKRWTEINNTDDDILRLKLAKAQLEERGNRYGI